ncbi:MAG: hypothetical protein ACREP2_12065, partial [Rhodanobacteraceae bacterium]
SQRHHAETMDYVHINPVKHGRATKAADRPWSSIHRCIRNGTLGADCAAAPDVPTFMDERQE